eukprot:gnl/Chilomastix_cuspidata/8735.p3 GENE.gnl/Chilomastix_cuspidata/8735~~gnl/Chilomastix_cuspidata/8735.p3  ORF type:complete len:120 (-),score=19.72 gnl/Chilomastix_cuspidata/8735:511-870(-)
MLLQNGDERFLIEVNYLLDNFQKYLVVVSYYYEFCPNEPKPPIIFIAIDFLFSSLCFSRSFIQEINKICKESLSSINESSIFKSIISLFPLIDISTIPPPAFEVNILFAFSSFALSAIS